MPGWLIGESTIAASKIVNMPVWSETFTTEVMCVFDWRTAAKLIVPAALISEVASLVLFKHKKSTARQVVLCTALGAGAVAVSYGYYKFPKKIVGSLVIDSSTLDSMIKGRNNVISNAVSVGASATKGLW